MNEILFFSLVLIISLSTFLAKKLNIIPISAQMITTIMLVVLFGHHMDKEIIKNNLHVFYQVNFILILYFILIELKDLKITKTTLKVSIISFLMPFIAGIFLGYSLLAEENIKTLVLIGLLCAITAVPVLFIYLKEFNYEQSVIKTYLSIAIFIDLICWLSFSILNNKLSFFNLGITILLGAIPLLCRKNKYAIGILFLMALAVAEYFQLNVLLVGLIYILVVNYLSLEIDLPVSSKNTNRYQTYIAIPVLLLYGFVQINFTNAIDIKEMMFVFIAILLKISANYIGLSLTSSLTKIKRLQDSVFLNVRGLTEIMFLNMIYHLNYINESIYLLFIILSFISNLLPMFFSKSKNL